MSNPSKVKHFEKNLEALESLVDTLESGELSLEESLKQFEKGIKMTQDCQDALTAAEQRVHVLLEKDGDITLEDFPQHDQSTS